MHICLVFSVKKFIPGAYVSNLSKSGIRVKDTNRMHVNFCDVNECKLNSKWRAQYFLNARTILIVLRDQRGRAVTSIVLTFICHQTFDCIEIITKSLKNEVFSIRKFYQNWKWNTKVIFFRLTFSFSRYVPIPKLNRSPRFNCLTVLQTNLI